MQQCPRCLNDDPSLFALRGDEWYCRACVGLLGRLAEVEEEQDGVIDPNFSMGFELTVEQKKISNELVAIGLETDVLVEAVCGAGKTEIVLELVSKALSLGLKVGWVVARRQVVLQLGERLKSMFSHLSVICVVGGLSESLMGDLILLTAHQLYRYPSYFDLVIVDEPDAFPFKGDKLLAGLLNVASIGTKVYLTATPDDGLVNLHHLKLEKRPHNRPLVVPKVIRSFYFINLIWLITKVHSFSKVLVFVPTIKEAMFLSRLLRCHVITSKSKNKEKIIEEFDGQGGILVCTTVLERGVTFKGVSVIVFNAGHRVFDEASLVQICGRVDRSFNNLGGECIILCHSYNKAIDDCVNRLKTHNLNAFGV